MAPEVIEIDSDDEVVCTGQFRRVAINPPRAVVVDLTSDGDDAPGPSAPHTVIAGPSRRPTPATTSGLARSLENARRQKEEAPSRAHSLPERGELIEISDDEEDDFEGLDLNYTPNWSAEPVRLGASRGARDLEKDLSQTTQELVRSLPVIQRCKGKAASTSILPRCHWDPHTIETSNDGIWTKLRSLRSGSRPAFSLAQRSGRSAIPLSKTQVHLEKARVRSYDRFSPGSVNTIVQSGPLTVIASCVLGGDTDYDEQNMAYNKEGTLKALYHDTEEILREGHEDTRLRHIQGQGENTQYDKKTYTVNDVQFDPADPTRFVSCGRDRKVILWNCAERETVSKHRAVRCKDAIPEGLQYKPTGSVVVIWANNGTCLLYNGFDTPPVILEAGSAEQPVQSVAWGRGRFSNKLYTTSGTEGVYEGQHRCFDIGAASRRGQSFGSDTAGGECLDMNLTGTWLAHATCSENNIFKLSLYDPDRLRQPAQEIELPKFALTPDSDHKPRIQQVLFSPDSVYLAVARSDNLTHVYDARFLGPRYLYALPHGPAVEATREDSQYGINRIEWLQDGAHGLSLVSCGADGCVRLWDIKHAWSDYSDVVLAQSTSYAGWFSLGDMYKGEKPLIMGDGSGNVVVCDRIDIPDPKDLMMSTTR